MNRVLEYIQTNLDHSLLLDELSKIACFSPYHFHRIFSGMVGESLKSYIRRLRLERAAVTLKHKDTAVTTVALDAGFATHESFTRAFTSMFGVSPQGFRKTHQINIKQNQIVYWKEITMKIKIIELEDMEVAFVRNIGPYAECQKSWQTLCNWAKEKNLDSNPKFISLCYDDPQITPSDKVRHDACLEIPSTVQVKAPIAKKTIYGGRYAMAIHKGSYKNLAETYAQLCGQWAPQNGYEVDAKASIQIYLKDYRTTATENLLTEVYVPLS